MDIMQGHVRKKQLVIVGGELPRDVAPTQGSQTQNVATAGSKKRVSNSN